MKKLIYICMALFITVAVQGQESLDIKQAVEITMKNNYDIRMAENNADIMENNATAGNAGLLPRLDLSGGITYSNNDIQDISGTIDQEYSVTNSGLSISYTLFDGLGSIYNLKGLKLTAKNGSLQSKLTIETTLLQLINSFYLVATARENLDLSEELLKISKDRLERQKTKKTFGKSSGLELLNAEVDFNNDSITYMNALKSHEQMKRELNVIMGRDPETDFEIQPFIDGYQNYTYKELAAKAFTGNTSYKMSEIQLKQSENDLQIVNSGFSPRLNLSSSYGYNQQVNGLDVAMDNPNMNFSTALSLSFNIFDGGVKRTQRQNARIAIQNSSLQLEENKLNLEKNIRNALTEYETYLEVLEAEKRNLRSAVLNFEQSKEYYNLGQISSTQFREAQLNLISSKANINAAKYNAKTAEMELLRLSGRLVE